MQELTDAERELIEAAVRIHDDPARCRYDKNLSEAIALVRRERLERTMPGWEAEFRQAARRMHESWAAYNRMVKLVEPAIGHGEVKRITDEEEQ